MELNDINKNRSTNDRDKMSDDDNSNGPTDKDATNIELQPFIAPVNHNTLTFAKAINNVHTLIGNFCHGNKERISQREDMGNDACILIGYQDKVRFVINCRIIQVMNNLI
jgi:hypothetical protein